MKVKDFILLAAVAVISYLPILSGFFAQDEWNAFGIFYDKGFQVVSGSLIPGLGHYVPLTQLVNFGLFRVFNLNYVGYAATSIFLHAIVVILVYLFFSGLTKDRVISLIGGLIFAVNPSGYQATSWVLTDIANHGAVIMSILACSLFLLFLDKKKWKTAVISIGLLFFSLLFKEITIGIFLWLLVLTWTLKEKDRFKVITFILVIPVFVYIVIRGIGIYTTTDQGNVAPYKRTQTETFYTILTLPIKSAAQTLVPPISMFDLSYSLAISIQKYIPVKYGTTAFDNFVESKIFESMNFLIFGLEVFTLVFIWKKSKSKEKNKTLIFLALLWPILNGLVYAASLGKVGVIHEIESRDLYLPEIGTILYLVLILKSIFKSKLKFSFVVALIFVTYIIILEKSLYKIDTEGQIRKKILVQIEEQHPILPKKVIFYTESDRSYYGLPTEEKILPFQSGLGQTLLVWYQSRENFPKEFFRGNYLWDIESQGYKEEEGTGFGYFRDFQLLKDSIKKNKIPIDSVIAYSYNSQTNSLIDVSNQIRMKLRNEQVN